MGCGASQPSAGGGTFTAEERRLQHVARAARRRSSSAFKRTSSSGGALGTSAANPDEPSLHAMPGLSQDDGPDGGGVDLSESSQSKAPNLSLIGSCQRLWYGTAIKLHESADAVHVGVAQIDEALSDYFCALMIVANADGLSKEEMQWLHDRARLMDLPVQMVDPNYVAVASSQQVDEILGRIFATTEPEPAAPRIVEKLLYFDAVTMAAQDEYSTLERERAARAANILKLDSAGVEELEAIVHLEVGLRRHKGKLFASPASAPGRSGSISYAAAADARASCAAKISKESALKLAAFQRQFYGVEVELEDEFKSDYLFALLSVAGADGCSSFEKAWLRDRGALLGLPASAVNTMIDFDFSHRNSFSMDGVMESLTGPVAKLLIYDALTMAAVDGISIKEDERATKAAAAMGLDTATYDQIHSLVASETRLLLRKRSIFTGAGEPFSAAAILALQSSRIDMDLASNVLSPAQQAKPGQPASNGMPGDASATEAPAGAPAKERPSLYAPNTLLVSSIRARGLGHANLGGLARGRSMVAPAYVTFALLRPTDRSVGDGALGNGSPRAEASAGQEADGDVAVVRTASLPSPEPKPDGAGGAEGEPSAEGGLQWSETVQVAMPADFQRGRLQVCVCDGSASGDACLGSGSTAISPGAGEVRGLKLRASAGCDLDLEVSFAYTLTPGSRSFLVLLPEAEDEREDGHEWKARSRESRRASLRASPPPPADAADGMGSG